MAWNLLLDFLRPSPSLSTVSSDHTTRRELPVAAAARERGSGRNRRMPTSCCCGAGSVVSVSVREGPAAAAEEEDGWPLMVRATVCSDWKGSVLVIGDAMTLQREFWVVRWGYGAMMEQVVV